MRGTIVYILFLSGLSASDSGFKRNCELIRDVGCPPNAEGRTLCCDAPGQKYQACKEGYWRIISCPGILQCKQNRQEGIDCE